MISEMNCMLINTLCRVWMAMSTGIRFHQSRISLYQNSKILCGIMRGGERAQAVRTCEGLAIKMFQYSLGQLHLRPLPMGPASTDPFGAR